MKNYDLLDLATRNLRESKLRNSLTTMGIAVGVASLVAMLSLGIGLQQLANNRLNRSGLFDTVFVTSYQDQRGGNDDDRDEKEKPTQPDRVLDEAAAVEMRKLGNVTEVAPEIRVMAEVRFNENSYPAFLGALPASARNNDAFEGMQGTYFTSQSADEAILQKEFAQKLDKNFASLVGKQLVLRYAERKAAEVSAQSPGADSPSQADDPGAGGGSTFSVIRREKPLKIVGIIENEPFGGLRMISRAGIFLPTEAADRLNMMQFSDVRNAMRTQPSTKAYSMLTVRISSPGKVGEVQEAIKKMGFRTYSILDATKSLRRFFTIFDLFLGIFGSLALAVASLAIINTLVMAVLERRREIGVMKALGASDADVKKLFFAEAGGMGVTGGALGVLLGWLIGRVINIGTNIYLNRQNLPNENLWFVPWWLVLGAIGFAIGVSLLAGLYPAARAAKLDPIQALRYE